jgi:hypothetical protein
MLPPECLNGVGPPISSVLEARADIDEGVFKAGAVVSTATGIEKGRTLGMKLRRPRPSVGALRLGRVPWRDGVEGVVVGLSVELGAHRLKRTQLVNK